MPLVCKQIPNRSEERKFNAAAAARIICYAVASGSSIDEIVARAKRRCPDERKPREDLSNEAAIEMAMQNIALNNIELLDTYRFFAVINGILAGILLVTRFIPGPIRLVQLVAAPARVQVAQLVQRNIAQRAANDELYSLLGAILQAQRALRLAA